MARILNVVNPNDPVISVRVVWNFTDGVLPAGLTVADYQALTAGDMLPVSIFSGGAPGSSSVMLQYPSAVGTGDPWSCTGSNLFPPASGTVQGT